MLFTGFYVLMSTFYYSTIMFNSRILELYAYYWILRIL